MTLPAENIPERTVAYSTFQRGTSPLQRRNEELRYFGVCISRRRAESRVPDAGSFIRPGKKTDGERTFVDGVRGKYASNPEYERVVLEDSGKEIEMIGFDKIEQQQRFSLVISEDVMVVI
jgi:hypothetical protein